MSGGTTRSTRVGGGGSPGSGPAPSSPWENVAEAGGGGGPFLSDDYDVIDVTFSAESISDFWNAWFAGDLTRCRALIEAGTVADESVLQTLAFGRNLQGAYVLVDPLESIVLLADPLAPRRFDQRKKENVGRIESA